MNLTGELERDHVFACHGCRATAHSLLEASQHVRGHRTAVHSMLEVQEDAGREHGWAARAKRIIYFAGGEVVSDAMRWDKHYGSVRPARAIAADNDARARRMRAPIG